MFLAVLGFQVQGTATGGFGGRCPSPVNAPGTLETLVPPAINLLPSIAFGKVGEERPPGLHILRIQEMPLTLVSRRGTNTWRRHKTARVSQAGAEGHTSWRRVGSGCVKSTFFDAEPPFEDGVSGKASRQPRQWTRVGCLQGPLLPACCWPSAPAQAVIAQPGSPSRGRTTTVPAGLAGTVAPSPPFRSCSALSRPLHLPQQQQHTPDIAETRLGHQLPLAEAHSCRNNQMNHTACSD